MFEINIKLLEPYYGLLIVLLLLSIIYCFMYNIHLSTFFGTVFFIFIVINIFCYLFNITLAKLILTYFVPLFELILYLYYLVVSLLYLPFYLIYAIWGAFIRLLSIFSYILKFINDITMFFYSFVNDIYTTE
jgi:hypothetical protein